MVSTQLSFQTLSFLPAPRQPVALLEELDPLPPPSPRDGFLSARPLLSDGADEATFRRVRVESESFGVPSPESRRSFSENLPEVHITLNHPPNRILHDFHTARMDNMLEVKGEEGDSFAQGADS